MEPEVSKNLRILLVDDQAQLHDDYKKILALEDIGGAEFDSLEADFFGESETKAELPTYEIESAFQGEEAVEMVRQANADGKPFALAFMDVRMPPGIDGIETIKRIREIDTRLQFVISTAYADYVWEDIFEEFGPNDDIVFLRKPFDSTEVHQLASTLTEKWNLSLQAKLKMSELEGMVQNRTEELEAANHELANALNELREAQTRLVNTEKIAALGKLVAGVAHEVNTPIGAVVSSSDVIKRAVDRVEEKVEQAQSLDVLRDDKKFQQALGLMRDSNATILTAGKRIDSIIRSLKTFSRVDEAERKKVDLRDGLDSTLTVLQHDLGDRITVIREYEDIPEINCYPGELNQVFLNLVSNAIAAIDGAGTITIQTQHENGRVLIAIRDTGRGIKPAQLEKLFDFDFQRRSQRVKLGWGLATCRQVVHRHKGEIKVASEPGKGSVFTVILPVIK